MIISNMYEQLNNAGCKVIILVYPKITKRSLHTGMSYMPHIHMIWRFYSYFVKSKNYSIISF